MAVGLRRALTRLPTAISARPGAVRGVALGARASLHQGVSRLNQASLQQPSAFRAGQVRFFSKVDVMTPELGGESITEGTIGSWNVKVGDNVKKGAVIAEIETDKVTVEVKAEQDGQILELKVQADDTVEVGSVLAVMGPPGEGVPAAAPAAAAPAAAAPAAASAPAPAPKAAAPAAAPAAAAAPSAPQRGERREKMKRMRLAVARNLKDSQNTLAQLTTFQEVDMSGLIKMRKEYKDAFQASHGAKLGFQSPFFMASTYALKQIPGINAYIDDQTNEIVYRDFINIGFAAATPKGLVTPVIKNMESKNLAEVESEFAHFAGLAKQDKLSMDDITGNTFTITNGGVFGSMLGTPLIGSRTTAGVLGLHATKDRPVVLPNGEVGIRPIMYLALTYDHRLVDGREAVTFLCMVRDQVEDPRRLLLEI